MFNLGSIKAKSIAYTLLVMLVPLIILGTLGTLYFHDLVKHNIENDYREEARTIADLTDNYLDNIVLYIESQAERSTLINALDRGDVAALDAEVEKIVRGSDPYYWTFVTDTSGRVISSQPYSRVAGSDMSDKPFISRPLSRGKTYISSLQANPVTGRRTATVGTPVSNNGTIVGVLAGALDDSYYSGILSRASNLEPLQNIFLVNGSGQIIFSHDKKYLGRNISDVHAVQKVVKGEEGVEENSSFVEEGQWIVAYSPVENKPGIGALVAIPQETVYGPINTATALLAGDVILLSVLASLLAILAANHLTRPVTNIATAASHLAEGVDVRQSGLDKYLPYDRNDELGGLARAFRDMSDRIMAAREKILGEKKYADMYIDVMGHDINNLNQVILSRLEFVQHYGTLNAQQKECLNGAIEATRESAAIIGHVKTIQAVTTETPELQTIDLDRTIQDCIREAPRPEDKKVTIRYTPQKGLAVKAVPGIKNAFCNVIRNSIKYSGQEVEVEIDVGHETKDGIKYLVTTIDDNGNGIPEETMKTLFTRFQQGSAVPPGKGLGVYATKLLVEHSGGSIRIENRIPGDYKKGTRVIISLPAGEAREE